LGAGGSAVVGAILAGRDVSDVLAGSALQAEGKEFHGAWPFLVPPTGHFNLLTGITNGILGSTSGGPLSIYADLVISPMAMYQWKNAEWLPFLAEEWGFSPETDEFTVTLKNGLTWSDGQPLTSQDVVTTFWGVRAFRNVVWNYIDSVEALDERAVKFHMSKPSTVVERYVLKLQTVSHAVYGELAGRVQALFEGGQDMDSPEGQ
jgi:peptide/nickel transport system substrate-binding protein